MDNENDLYYKEDSPQGDGLRRFSYQEGNYDLYNWMDSSRREKKEDDWDAMTDGQYGDMPEGFDGDYSFLGY